MKQTLLFLCLVAILGEAGCALQDPIDQQTLEQNKLEQSNRKSDAFANGLPQ